ncbi:hypothetical protein [Bordetella pertussis]|uniref:hypothetical protein n=1 Tax=Bordetella pertussis TaxID=520 RepID=UPI0015F24BE5|nr:hypothetical protein [Bordetella pertussis]
MNWEVGDFQFLKSGSDEPCIQPIESSHLAPLRQSSPRIPAMPCAPCRRASARVAGDWPPSA